MNHRRFTLNERECAEFQGAYHNSGDGQTRLRFQAVRLYRTGHRVDEIVAICGCPRTSLLTWCRTYRDEGITGLLDHRKGGNSAKLTVVQIETLRHWLQTYTPAQILGLDLRPSDGAFWTVPDLVHLVQERFGVTYKSANSYRSLFKRCGLSR